MSTMSTTLSILLIVFGEGNTAEDNAAGHFQFFWLYSQLDLTNVLDLDFMLSILLIVFTPVALEWWLFTE